MGTHDGNAAMDLCRMQGFTCNNEGLKGVEHRSSKQVLPQPSSHPQLITPA